MLYKLSQGTFEADEDRVVRIKFYQFYGFGQYPKAVVFDKVDIVGSTIHPFYRYVVGYLWKFESCNSAFFANMSSGKKNGKKMADCCRDTFILLRYSGSQSACVAPIFRAEFTTSSTGYLILTLIETTVTVTV